jgi:hypothetical protein
MPGAGVVHHIIFDRRCGFRLPFDVCSSPKATYPLHSNEMTRRADSGSRLTPLAAQHFVPFNVVVTLPVGEVLEHHQDWNPQRVIWRRHAVLG